MIQFTVNGFPQSTDAPADTPLLWVIREGLKLTGTKFGCGAGLCGACMVHIDGARAFSCQTRIGDVAGRMVTTIEGVIGRFQPSRATGMGSRARAAMRLLSVGSHHERGRPASAKPSSHPKRNRRAYERAYLSLRDLSTDDSSYRARGAGGVT
jgi:hypothetical protein